MSQLQSAAQTPENEDGTKRIVIGPWESETKRSGHGQAKRAVPETRREKNRCGTVLPEFVGK